jgi:hypothetical protein
MVMLGLLPNTHLKTTLKINLFFSIKVESHYF